MKLPPYSTDFGLFILRLGIGVMFVFHGLPKLLGGPSGWESLGSYGMPFLPEGLLPTAFGFLAMAAELGGGVLLALGALHRLACVGLFATMVVAFSTKLGDISGVDNFAQAAGWPLELAIVFLALFFTGPGRYALGSKAG